MVRRGTRLRGPAADVEIAMKTIGENTDTTVKTENLHAAPRPQDVMAIAQREQSTAFKQFFKSWRCARRPHSQETLATSIVFGAR